MNRWYFVCSTCSAKWFADQQLALCPRCGGMQSTTELTAVPWFKYPRRKAMRITLKNYEKARKIVEQAKEQRKVVDTWNDALKQIGDLGNQKLVAIQIDGNGEIHTQCKLQPHGPEARNGE